MAITDSVKQLISFLTGVAGFYKQTIILDGSKWETMEWRKVPTMTPYFTGKCRYSLDEITQVMGASGDIKLYLYASIDSQRGAQLFFLCDSNEPMDMEEYPWFKISLTTSRKTSSLELKIGARVSNHTINLPSIRSPEELMSTRLEIKVLACLMPPDQDEIN